MSHSIHSDVSALPIGTKRFDKGPYFNFYHKENNKYGVYAERFYPISERSIVQRNGYQSSENRNRGLRRPICGVRVWNECFF